MKWKTVGVGSLVIIAVFLLNTLLLTTKTMGGDVVSGYELGVVFLLLALAVYLWSYRRYSHLRTTLENNDSKTGTPTGTDTVTATDSTDGSVYVWKLEETSNKQPDSVFTDLYVPVERGCRLADSNIGGVPLTTAGANTPILGLLESITPKLLIGEQAWEPESHIFDGTYFELSDAEKQTTTANGDDIKPRLRQNNLTDMETSNSRKYRLTEWIVPSDTPLHLVRDDDGDVVLCSTTPIAEIREEIQTTYRYAVILLVSFVGTAIFDILLVGAATPAAY